MSGDRKEEEAEAAAMGAGGRGVSYGTMREEEEAAEAAWSVLQEYVDIGSHPVVESEVKGVLVNLLETYQELSRTLRKANILLVGKTGAGKSSLVNAVFGSAFAETGSGEPVTKHLSRYAGDDVSKEVVVYDTRGLEHGSHAEFIAEIRGFIGEMNSSSDASQHIHVVWYVVDMSHSRFQPFEAEVCRNLLSEVAVFFILNKTDTASAKQVAAVSASIEDFRFPNCRGIFEVVSDRQNYDFTACPVCHAADFRFKNKSKEIICDNSQCGARVAIGKYSGLEALIEATTDQLPEWARHCFITAQEVSEKERLEVAKSIILHATSDKGFSLKVEQEQTHVLTEMASQLAYLWGYRLFPSIITKEVADHFYRRFASLGLLRRLSFILAEIVQNRLQCVAVAVVLGVELCRLFCEIKMKAVGWALHPHATSGQESLVARMDKMVSGLELSEELVQRVALDIKASSVEEVLTKLLEEKIAVYCSRRDWVQRE